MKENFKDNDIVNSLWKKTKNCSTYNTSLYMDRDFTGYLLPLES